MITRREFIRCLSLLAAALHLPLPWGDPAKEPDSANTWHRAYGVFSANDARVVSLDGETKAGPLTPAPVQDIVSNSKPFTGAIIRGMMWNVAFTDADIASMAAGFAPFPDVASNVVF